MHRCAHTDEPCASAGRHEHIMLLPPVIQLLIFAQSECMHSICVRTAS